jgi:hypothetical protein
MYLKDIHMRQHLKDINETYFEHLRFACRCGFRMALAGIACILHGLWPSIFISTASDTLKSLTDEINQRKEKAKLTTANE